MNVSVRTGLGRTAFHAAHVIVEDAGALVGTGAGVAATVGETVGAAVGVLVGATVGGGVVPGVVVEPGQESPCSILPLQQLYDDGS